MSLELPDELPEGYYLDNFEFLLRFVLERYDNLLTNTERDFSRRFLASSPDARRLYVRMANRKGECFRCDKLSYAEIQDMAAAMAELVQRELATPGSPDTETAISLCTRDELARTTVAADCARSVRRDELVALLMQSGTNPLEELGVDTIQILGMDYLMVFRLLFFGNFHQDMTEFVLHELVSPFESYDLTRETSLFSDRSVVEEMIRLRQLSECSRDVIAEDDSGDDILQLISMLGERPEAPLLARRYDKTVNRLARQLERLDRHEEALLSYRLSRAAPSRERQARILAGRGEVQAALSLCELINESPGNEDEWEFSISFGTRIAKKHRLTDRFSRTGTPGKVSQQRICVPRTHDRVEISALAHYQTSGMNGWYVENALIRGLFGLAFWDIIFAPVPGVFFHPFQRGPDDLFTADFVANRREMIDSRMEELLLADRLQSRIRRCFDEKYGVANQFVHWPLLEPELVHLATSAIDSHHLCLIFDRMLTDLRHNASGLPDLVLFDDDGYRMVEIKGPGDKLQKNQMRWFRFFQQHDIPAEVVDVIYSD